RGFLLNNQLSDFSFEPTDAQGRPVANRVEPGKRPRSSMAPTLVFDKRSGELLMTAGSPGGPVIIHFVAKTLYGMLNWGLSPQQAVSLPNFAVIDGPLMLEQGRFSADVRRALQENGHTLRDTPMTSGVQALRRTPTGLLGGADPRREGLVMGE
ncbi:MAG: gamma-glutamyltransferase, partial [Burkholderiaceae bacterium]|nr:gamma-glutamyltransferase [Burkholderiaceae bacterium]